MSARRRQRRAAAQRRPQRFWWLAKCDGCERIGDVVPSPRTGKFHSPCHRCGSDTATYAKVAA